MDVQIDTQAQIVYEYMQLHQALAPSDVIVGMGSSDSRVAIRAAHLFLAGYGKIMVFTGGYGKITGKRAHIPEAEAFQKIAINQGVPAHKILIEDQATNSGDNILFVSKLLAEHDIHPRSLLVVTKTYMERRAYAAYTKRLEGQNVRIQVTSPQLTYEQQQTTSISKKHWISLMVGDLQRIQKYPALGYQILQEIPTYVQRAYEILVNAGYTDYLLQSN